MESIRAEIVKLSTEASILEEKTEAFKPEREKLSRALQAAELEGYFASLSVTRQQQASDQTALKADEEKLPQHELNLSEQEKLLKTAEQNTISIKTTQKAAAPLLQKVRSLDLKASEKSNAIAKAEAEVKKTEDQITTNREKLGKIAKTQKTAEKELERIQAFLAANSHDEALVSEFSAITELAGSLQSVSTELAARKAALEEEQKQAKKQTKNYKAREKDFLAVTQEYEDAQKKVVTQTDKIKKLLGDRLLSEYRVDYQALQQKMIYLNKIAKYEEDRKKLEDGCPCPLCGATEHPFAMGNIPEMNETDKQSAKLARLIEKAEALEAQLKELQENERKLLKKYAEAEKKFTKATHEKETSGKDLKKLATELAAAEKNMAKAKEVTLGKLKAHGIKEIAENNVDSMLATLKDRLKEWKAVRGEWNLVCMAWNIKKLYALGHKRRC